MTGDGSESSEADDQEGSTAFGVAAETVAAAISGAIGLSGGPLAPLIGTAVYPILERLTTKAVQEVRDARWQRSVRSVSVATSAAGIEEEEFLQALSTRPHLLDLAGEAIQAASNARLDAKVKALGTALAEGFLAKDDALIDMEFFVVRALDALEAPHVRLLDFIIQYEPRVVDAEMVEAMLPSFAPVWESLMQTLRQHALIREVQSVTPGRGVSNQATFLSEPEVFPTQFGHDVLERFRVAGMDTAAGATLGDV